MFRSNKVPFVALAVAVAFTAYVLGPERFRKEKITISGGALKNGVGATQKGRYVNAPPGDADMPGADSAPGRARLIPTPNERFSRVLDDLQELARQAKLRRARNAPADVEVRAIRSQQKKLEALQPEIGSSFQATARYLQEKRLPAEVLQRSFALELEVANRIGELSRLLARMAAADDQGQAGARDAALGRLLAFFDEHRQGAPPEPLNVDRLPFRPASSNVRPPAMTPGAFPAHLRGTARSQSLQTAAPVDPNLAPTQDAQITQAVKDLAASLGNSPVQIFNWVRNNIVWIPTYGSVNGSAVTLATKRGNAFDTSSLLIALYRAAGIPARYVYGTVQVPGDKVANWAGASSAIAAQQLMGQGGIPNVTRVDGGSVSSVLLEHVWVEAFVDFVPSRGAINKAPDTWVQLDPSFKQYRTTAPVDVKSAIPVELNNTAAAVAKPAIADHVHPSITGLDQNVLDAWTDKMGEDIAFKYGSSPDLGALTGTRTILPEESTILAGSIPNKVITRAGTWAEVPDNLRHKITMTLYGGSELDRVLGGSQMTYQTSLANLAGRRLGITYVPATDADASTLKALQTGPDGDMPVYLVQVRPSIRIDDVEVARGPSATMGSQQGWDAGLIGPNDPNPDIHTYEVSAGDELVWGIDAQGISQDIIHQRFLQRPSDTAAENLFTVALYYWGQHDVLTESMARTRNAVVQRLPSLGLFSAPLRCGYFFGVPRTGHYSSRQMDVAHSIFATVEGDTGGGIDFQRAVGMLGSLLEGRTFDSLFGRPTGVALSAVQLLRDANEQKIPIYLITAANLALIAPQLQLAADIQGSIQNAVAAGKRVLVSQRAPYHGNWSGTGYIIEDPATGAAAYLINGGLNGGSDDDCPPQRRRQPVRDLIFEIFIIILIIILIILLWPYLVAIGGAIAGVLGGAGELAPVAALLLVALGLAATPTSAQAAVGPAGPGEGMLPPGDCTPQQYAGLVAAKVATCDTGPSCKTADCATATAALSRLQGCVAARLAIMTTCFRGGDLRHQQALEQANRAVVSCACVVARNCGH